MEAMTVGVNAGPENVDRMAGARSVALEGARWN